MALTDLEGIREWRDQLEEMDVDLLGIKPGTLVQVLSVLFVRITELEDQLVMGKTTGDGVQTVPIGKQRRIRGDSQIVRDALRGPDLL